MPSFWPTKLNKFSCMDQGGFTRWRDLSPALSEVSVSASTPCEAKRSTDVSWTTDYYMTISRKKSVQLASPKYDQGSCYAKCVWPGMMTTTLTARLCPHCSWKMLKSDFAAPDQRTKTRQHLTPASRRKIVETPNYNPSNCITDHHEL